MCFTDSSALQKEREERVRKIREAQEEERNKKIEELKCHVSSFFIFCLWKNKIQGYQKVFIHLKCAICA